MEILQYSMSRENIEHMLNSHTTLILQFLNENKYLTKAQQEFLNKNVITVTTKKGWWGKFLDNVIFKDKDEKEQKDLIMITVMRENCMNKENK